MSPRVTIEVRDDASVVLRVDGKPVAVLTQAEWSESLAHPIRGGGSSSGGVHEVRR